MRHWMRLIVGIGILGSCLGCTGQEPAQLPEEHRIVSTCYNPFFKAADDKDKAAMLRVLSQETIQHFEKNVFQDPKGAVQNWEEFTLAYGSMHISKFVSDVLLDGDKAVVKDPVGGTLKCVREGENWKVDLTP